MLVLRCSDLSAAYHAGRGALENAEDTLELELPLAEELDDTMSDLDVIDDPDSLVAFRSR
jgi:hypothetical protein